MNSEKNTVSKIQKNQFKRLQKKNLEEIRSLLSNLSVRLKEIEQQAEALQIDQIRKRLKAD